MGLSFECVDARLKSRLFARSPVLVDNALFHGFIQLGDVIPGFIGRFVEFFVENQRVDFARGRFERTDGSEINLPAPLVNADFLDR